MSFARSDVRKDNSFQNAKAPLLQKIFHLLSTTAIFCLLSVARVWPGVYRPRAVLAPASRLGARLPSRAYLPLASPSLLGVRPFGGHLRGFAPRFGPASPSLLGLGPLWGHSCGLAPRLGPVSPSLLGARPLGGHPCGLAPRFGTREPVAHWRGAPLGPSLRARTPFWGPRARCSLARGPSVAIFAGSHLVFGPASPSLLGVGGLGGHLFGLAPQIGRAHV